MGGFGVQAREYRQGAAREERNQAAHPGTGSNRQRAFTARSRGAIRIGQRQGRQVRGQRLAEQQMLIRIEMNAVDRGSRR